MTICGTGSLAPNVDGETNPTNFFCSRHGRRRQSAAIEEIPADCQLWNVFWIVVPFLGNVGVTFVKLFSRDQNQAADEERTTGHVAGLRETSEENSGSVARRVKQIKHRFDNWQQLESEKKQ